MVDELAALGCTTPVLPGVMPPLQVPGLIRMATMNGSVLPETLMARLEPVADDTDAVRDIGIEVATDLSRRLLDAGSPGLHLYALNRSYSALRIIENLGLR